MAAAHERRDREASSGLHRGPARDRKEVQETMRTLSRIALVLLVMLAAGAAFAQDTGSVRGTVTDSTGAIVPGATVTLQNEATKFSRNVISDAKGEYYFGAVSPGAYSITV